MPAVSSVSASSARRSQGGDVELHVGGADLQVRCAEYLHHHHGGARVETEVVNTLSVCN